MASLQPVRALLARRSAVLFCAALLIAVSVTFVLRDSRGSAAPDATGRRTDDLAAYVAWMRLVTVGGIQDAYHGTYVDTYSVYGPVILYGYEAVGTAYEKFVDPTYDRQRAENSVWPVRGIKATALGWHLLTAVAIYLFVRRLAGPAPAGLAAALYAANPVALYDVARWGQPDGAHSLFAVLTIGLLLCGAPMWAWATLALGVLAKPQGLLILPLVVLATWRIGGRRGLYRGVAAAAVVSAVVVLPFVLSGRFGDLLGVPSTIASVQPSVTANAYNAWWLIFGLGGIADRQSVLDMTTLAGPFTYRLVAGVCVAINFLLTGWLYWTRRAGLAEVAALGVLGWFLLTTQAHENHLFVALPVLALAWPGRPGLLIVFALLSLTIFINMLGASALPQLIGSLAGGRLLAGLRDLTAGLNVGCYVVWAVVAAVRPPAKVCVYPHFRKELPAPRNAAATNMS